ncbi:MAG TPA: response regulator, partial [Anaerolineales bacterium]|nr:response regulator [Anaerolineales bacterium]
DASFRPQLILLDLHLPDIDGIEILRRIKAADEWRAIPVVLLTTSATDGEIARAYSNHAISYLVKPIGSDESKELIHVLCSYWFGKNRCPKICVAIDEVQHVPIAPQLRRGDYQAKTASTV